MYSIKVSPTSVINVKKYLEKICAMYIKLDSKACLERLLSRVLPQFIS